MGTTAIQLLVGLVIGCILGKKELKIIMEECKTKKISKK